MHVSLNIYLINNQKWLILYYYLGTILALITSVLLCGVSIKQPWLKYKAVYSAVIVDGVLDEG